MKTETQKDSLILEINLISAQGLKPPFTNLGRLKTYAVLWVDPSQKLRTQVDTLGAGNPTWNDKFLFRVAPEFITSDTSGVSVDIFADGHFKDTLVGSVRFLLGNCVKGTQVFNAVLIQRPSGKFEGVLNVATSVFDSVDFQLMDGLSAVCFRDLMGGEKRRRRLSRIGSRRRGGETGESVVFDLAALELPDGNDSTTSASHAASAFLKEMNSGESEGGGSLCGLMLQKRIRVCPSDHNLHLWAEAFKNGG